MRLMMQSLLADRFKLAIHFETREATVLALELVEPGKPGPKLIPHSQGPPCPNTREGDLKVNPVRVMTVQMIAQGYKGRAK